MPFDLEKFKQTWMERLTHLRKHTEQGEEIEEVDPGQIQDRLRKMLNDLCLLEAPSGASPFILSSGASSPLYFDLKRGMLNRECLHLTARAMLLAIDQYPVMPEAVGGMTMGADFITAAILMKAHEWGMSFGTIQNGCIVRREIKMHGTQNIVENAQKPGTPIIVVDDVVTTGKSLDEACWAFTLLNYRVVGVLTVVDRGESDLTWLANKYDVPVRSLFMASEFPKWPKNTPQV